MKNSLAEFGNRAAHAAGIAIESKFLRLSSPVCLGNRIEGWRVCWLGGWDKGRIFFVVMVERTCRPAGARPRSSSAR
jgi:hypothetical protein